MPGTESRILVVSRRAPRRRGHGADQRLCNMVEALSQVGIVDCLLVGEGVASETFSLLKGLGVSAVSIVPPEKRRFAGLRQLIWWSLGRAPLVTWLRSFELARAELHRGTSGEYDLYWFDRPLLHGLLAADLNGPSIVDYPDLHGQYLVRERALLADPPSSPSLRDLVLRWRRRKEIRCWSRLERRVAASASLNTLCSSEDSRALGMGRREVVPNGYEPPAEPAGEASTTGPPTLTFVGTMTYGPNADGARHLVEVVLPRILADLPEAIVEIVGRYDDRLSPLERHASVRMRGYVDDLFDILSRTHVLVVPVRFGSGTRIKILEGFAHKIPVVSTTFGAEGLDVQAGRHLMLEDDPNGFAAACLRLLEDRDLAARLVSEAHALYLRRYRWSRIRRRVEELASRELDRHRG